MPAWNHRYREIDIWGLPINLLFLLMAAVAGLVLAMAMMAGGSAAPGLALAILSSVSAHILWRKIRLGRRRSFEYVLGHDRQLRACRFDDDWERELEPMKDYEQRKLPRRIHEGCMLNDDGSVTVAFRFSGFSLYLDKAARRRAHDAIRSAIGCLEPGFVIEFHLCRRPDRRQSDAYRAHPIQRQRKITQWIRERMAATVAGREYRNSVYALVTRTAKRRGWLGGARTLKEQLGLADSVLALAGKIQAKLPGARLDSLGAYQSILALANNSRQGYSIDSAGQCAGWFGDGGIAAGGEDADIIRLADGRFVKSVWFENYPDAAVGFVCRLLQPPAAMHIVQAIKPVSLMDRQAIQRDINISASMASGANLAGARIKLQAHSEMQAWCAKGDHELYWNFYAMQIIDDDPARIGKLARQLGEWLAGIGGQVRDYADIQFAAWHYLLPGAAHTARRWRIDESEQITGMCPVHVPHQGAQTPLSLRLSTQNTAVNIGYRRGDIAHHVTIAMTGAGKSLDRCARLLESYGLGIDIYALEIGQSLWWAVEAVGGQYHRLDPDEVMVNPLPDRSCCRDGELPIEMLATTTTALSMLLSAGGALDQFELTATQLAIGRIYQQAERYAEPGLDHLLTELHALDHEQTPIVEAAGRLGDHLGAFLESAEGRRLMMLPQLSIKAGAVGCDLSKIKEKTPRLLKFYLVFIATKFSQLAYANNNPAEIVLDEMHEFVRQAPEVVGTLIDGIARMGRKNANYINLITQEEGEIEAIGPSVLNQILRKCLLYKQSGHKGLAERIGMPGDVERAWQAWRNPLAEDYRYALECIDGESWHELLLRFPEEIAILSRTDPGSLDLKRQISRHCQDPFERIRLFREMEKAAETAPPLDKAA